MSFALMLHDATAWLLRLAVPRPPDDASDALSMRHHETISYRYL